MSIIYDALQKTQRNREYFRSKNALPQTKSQHRNIKWMISVCLLLMMGASVWAIFSFYELPLKMFGKLNTTVTRQQTLAQKSVSRLAAEPGHPEKKVSKKTNKMQVLAPLVKQKIEVPAVVAQSQAPVSVPSAPRLNQVQEGTVLAASTENLDITRTLSKLTLNGVLISGQDKMALINNQTYHVGDLVEGLKVVRIEFDGVSLQKGTQLVELKVSI